MTPVPPVAAPAATDAELLLSVAGEEDPGAGLDVPPEMPPDLPATPPADAPSPGAPGGEPAAPHHLPGLPSPAPAPQARADAVPRWPTPGDPLPPPAAAA